MVWQSFQDESFPKGASLMDVA